MMLSQTNAIAGKSRWIRTFYALVVSLLTFGCLLSGFSEGRILALAALVVANAMLIGWAWKAWRKRFVGGRAHLSLSKDPLPHGIPLPCTFDFRQIVIADKWTITVTLESRYLNYYDGETSSDRILYRSRLCFPAQRQTFKRVCGEVIIPGEFPPTVESTKRIRNEARLLLMADDIEWEFELNTSRSAADDKNMTMTPSQTTAEPHKPTMVTAVIGAFFGIILSIIIAIDGTANNTLTWPIGVFLLGVVGLAVLIFFADARETRRLRFAVGPAHLGLSQDPLPHGVPIQCIFDLEQKVIARNWRVLVTYKSTEFNLTSWCPAGKEKRHSWKQMFPVQRQVSKLFTAEVILPIELPPTIESCKQTPDATALFVNTARLRLMADDVAWDFELRTRRPTNNEVAVHCIAVAKSSGKGTASSPGTARHA